MFLIAGLNYKKKYQQNNVELATADAFLLEKSVMGCIDRVDAFSLSEFC